MKIALVHDHLMQIGGAEKVLRVFQEIWPDAPTYTLLYDKKRFSQNFVGSEIRTSFLDRLPFAKLKYQWMLPLMPSAFESFDFSEFDVVVSSSSAMSKGIITSPNTLHICYCHTPTRYLWSDAHQYAKETKAPSILKAMLPPILTLLRNWDYLAAQRVDFFIANSNTVKERIKKYYGRDSIVLNPPVDLKYCSISNEPRTYFLAGGRFVPYKRFDTIIEAFNNLHMPLKIFGTGPIERDLKKMAAPNIEFVGNVTDEEKFKLFNGCKAFIHPQEEDFGITPIEAMASGRPVIALRKGGATETVAEGITGEFFDEPSWEELADTVIRFKMETYDPKIICEYAQKFSTEKFKEQLKNLVEAKLGEKKQNKL